MQLSKRAPAKCSWPRHCGEEATDTFGLLDYCPFHLDQVFDLRTALLTMPSDEDLFGIVAPWVDTYRELTDRTFDRTGEFDRSGWERELKRKSRKANAKLEALLPRCTRCGSVRALDPCRSCASPAEAKRLRYPAAVSA